jgi:hypothetical protein
MGMTIADINRVVPPNARGAIAKRAKYDSFKDTKTVAPDTMRKVEGNGKK